MGDATVLPTMYMRLPILCASLLILISQAFAQLQIQPPGATCLKGTIVATALDSHNNPVIDLDKTNFELESQQSLKITKVERPSYPPRLMLVADLRHRTAGPQNTQVVAAIARGFLRATPADARLAMLTFGSKETDRLNFSTAKEVIAQTIDKISSGAARQSVTGTSPFDSLVDAVKMFGAPLPGDSIFLISGPNFRSHNDLRSVKKLLVQSGIRVFLMGLYYVPPNYESYVRSELLGLCSDTGGVSMEPISLIGHWTPRASVEDGHWDVSSQGMTEAESMGQHMYAIAASGYQIQVEADHTSDAPLKLKLRVVAGNRKRSSKMRVAYQYKLFPCADN